MFGTPSLCVFVFAGLFLGGLAKGQNVEEPMVKFGMEILDTNIGIKIVELEKSRPIAKKLKEGDILLSTRRIIDGKWITSKIISEESVDEIKSWIREGERVLLTVLRMQSDSGGLKPLEIEIDAMDLMRPVEVKEINSDDVAYSVGSSDVPESVAMIVKVYYAITCCTVEIVIRHLNLQQSSDFVRSPFLQGIAEANLRARQCSIGAYPTPRNTFS